MAQHKHYEVRVPRSHVEVHKVVAEDEAHAKRCVLNGESQDVNVEIAPYKSADETSTSDWSVSEVL
jgi:hypothetical protein